MKGIEVTDIQITLGDFSNPDSSEKATVRIIFNDALILNGVKIIKGQFGHFISLPQKEANSPYKSFDFLSHNLRKDIQDKVLHEYARSLAFALPKG